MSSSVSWWTAGNNWLIAKANAHFSAWKQTPEGKKWGSNGNRSPYQCGYSQPDWMHEAREALGENDEVRFKRIKLDNL